MSLTVATLITGLFLVSLGILLLLNNPAVISTFKAMPRSQVASIVFFGSGLIWFLIKVAYLSDADFGEFRVYLFIGFAVVGILSFKYVPDFLAVRGLCVLMLMAATPLLNAAFGHYEYDRRLLMVSAVFIGIVISIFLGAVPYRLRDFFGWLFLRPVNARILGGGLLAYGILLSAIAFTY